MCLISWRARAPVLHVFDPLSCTCSGSACVLSLGMHPTSCHYHNTCTAVVTSWRRHAGHHNTCTAVVTSWLWHAGHHNTSTAVVTSWRRHAGHHNTCTAVVTSWLTCRSSQYLHCNRDCTRTSRWRHGPDMRVADHTLEYSDFCLSWIHDNHKYCGGRFLLN